ncbi:MAG: GNVR domain-containing protein [Steroidobacteraceae bacterium]
MNEIFSIIYGFARVAWRRRWVALGTAWIVAFAAWAVIMSLPDRYEASARVFVDARTPLRPVLEGIAIQSDYESQLALVREALLSRPQLEAVARRTNLNAKVNSPAQMDALVTGLKNQIVVNAFSPNNPAGSSQTRDAIYVIAYQNTDRNKSVEVVRTLLDNFMEGTRNGNSSGSNEAQNFLNDQIAELEKRLQQAEERLAAFKKQNIGLLPGDRGDYFTRLNQEMTGLQQAETNLAVAVSRRAELQRQLSNARAYLPGAGATGTAGVPPDVTLRRQEAEQKLEELLLRYTDRHPEVIALRQTIRELKEREVKELEELQRGGQGTGAIRSLSANPIYQQIQSQLSQVQVEIASHQGAAAQHRREIANLRQYVDQAPEIEQEFARLNRDYGVTKEQYDALVQRREQARVSGDAARSGIVRFDVIEPPRAPLTPKWPKRSLMIIASLFLAVAAGLGVAVLPHLFAPTFGDVGSLSRKFGLPVLGAVSAVHTHRQRAEEREEIRKVAIAGLALVALTGLMAIVGPYGARLLHSLFT